MPDTVFLVDMRRDDKFSRHVVDTERELLDFLEIEDAFDYLLVERIPTGRLKKGLVMSMRKIPSGK